MPTAPGWCSTPPPPRPLSSDLLALVDLITPNQTEAELLTGVKVIDEASAREAAGPLPPDGNCGRDDHAWAPKGSIAATGNSNNSSRVFGSKAVDTTAAGDTFNGALLAAELAGAEFREAVRFAHGAAALSVTQIRRPELNPQQS